MFVKKRRFENSNDFTLSAIFEGEREDSPVVILCHGYGSFKDKISTKSLAQKLVEKGLSVFRFDFTGCGQSDGVLGDLTPKQGLDDLTSAVKNLKREKFALFGSSFGGYVSLIYASKNPVQALGLRAPVSRYWDIKDEDLTAHQKVNFLNQVKNLDLYKEASNIKAPTLIVHGSTDDVVPLEQSQNLLKSLGGEKRLAVLRGAGHEFRDEYLKQSNDLFAEFFAEKLLT